MTRYLASVKVQIVIFRRRISVQISKRIYYGSKRGLNRDTREIPISRTSNGGLHLCGGVTMILNHC